MGSPEGVIVVDPAAEPSADEAEGRVLLVSLKRVVERTPGPLSKADGAAAGLPKAARRVKLPDPARVDGRSPAALPTPSADEADGRVALQAPKGVSGHAPGPLSPADGAAAGLPEAAQRVRRATPKRVHVVAPAALPTPALVEEPA